MIDDKAIDTLGDAPERPPAAGGHKAFAVSSGKASGPARVLAISRDAGDLGRGYVLVCPSTDPSWTPLFGNAAGLVLERGGMLSHGAVVARELGLPAVVLAGQLASFAMAKRSTLTAAAAGWENHWKPPAGIRPPIASMRRTSASPASWSRRLRGERMHGGTVSRPVCGGLDGLSAGRLPLAGAMGVSAGAAALDIVLWPIVRALGKPATVAIIAAGMAAAFAHRSTACHR